MPEYFTLSSARPFHSSRISLAKPGFELDRKTRFANFLLENLKESLVLESGNTACEKQNGGRFVANFVNFLKKL